MNQYFSLTEVGQGYKRISTGEQINMYVDKADKHFSFNWIDQTTCRTEQYRTKKQLDLGKFSFLWALIMKLLRDK